MMKNWEKYISDLDTERFGFKIAKFNSVEELTVGSTRQLKEQGVRLIIARVDAKNTDELNRLEKIEFEVKDIQVTYRHFLNEIDFGEYTDNSQLLVRDFVKEDVDTLILIAEESFSGYGHYFADRNLDRESCLAIYRDWTLRSCSDLSVANKVAVAEVNGQVAGFLSFKLFDGAEGRFAAGGLGAVGKEFRNQNVFRGLTKYGLLWGSSLNLDWEEHNVLVTNFSVNNSLSQIGFTTYKSFLTLHKWL